jgi:hypothetical protein
MEMAQKYEPRGLYGPWALSVPNRQVEGIFQNKSGKNFIRYLIIPGTFGIGLEFVDNVTELFPPKRWDLMVKIAVDGSVADR